jgi:hypothetical protein
MIEAYMSEKVSLKGTPDALLETTLKSEVIGKGLPLFLGFALDFTFEELN